MASLLISLSGAQPEILERCPTERVKFQSLGWAIVITSAVAVISMWFALSSVLGINAFVALLAALIWGLIIMGIDRWLVTSIPSDGRGRLAIALPRLLLALLLGSLISTPIILRIFQPEINAQISVIQEQRANTYLTDLQHSAVVQQVTYWTNQVANLQKVIDSNGSAPLNLAADPEIQSLTQQRNSALALEQKYYNQWQCQLYGGQGCRQGSGPLAQASEQSYNQAAAQVATLNNRILQRENQLSANSTASDRSRYQQATSALPSARQQLAAATAREQTFEQNFITANGVANGLLLRLEALNQLSGNNSTINITRFLLFLLFLVIECLPVTVRLFQRPGNYEKILAAAADHELRDARRAVNGRPWGGGLPVSGAEMRALWTHSEAVPSLASGAPPEPLLDEPEESDEHAQLEDEAMRMIEEVPVLADVDGRGIELHYDDDDL